MSRSGSKLDTGNLRRKYNIKKKRKKRTLKVKRKRGRK
tara:strand:- start:1180 stop:1293 length:114 start_codon:yes stop_codon:yes gene_type:complete